MKTSRTLLILFLLNLSASAESQQAPPPSPPLQLPVSGKISKANCLVNEGNIKGTIAEYKRIYILNPGSKKMISHMPLVKWNFMSFIHKFKSFASFHPSDTSFARSVSHCHGQFINQV